MVTHSYFLDVYPSLADNKLHKNKILTNISPLKWVVDKHLLPSKRKPGKRYVARLPAESTHLCFVFWFLKYM